MSSKYILIFAKTPYLKTPYDQWLEGTGITPLILTSTEYAEGYRHIPNVFCFSNYDKNQQVELKAFELTKKFNIIGVFARAEADIIRAAQIRTLAGLQGQNVLSAMAFRNKVTMKTALKKSPISIPEFQKINSAYDIFQFIEKFDYPVVIKPSSESGSLGTHIIRSEEDLIKYLENPFNAEMEIEKFIEGKMYHVDGLLLNNKIVFIQPFQYINDCLSFRKNEFVASCSVSPKDRLAKALIDATMVVLQHLPTAENMTFHAEFWVQPNGQLVFCEVASRTGGGMISSMIKNSFGLNLDQEWFYAECGIERELKIGSYKPGGMIIIPPSCGKLVSLPIELLPPFVSESQYCGKVGDQFNGGTKSGLFLAGYTIYGGSENAVKENISVMANWFANNSKWETEGI